METRANYILIGLFTILVVAAGFGFVYWFSGTGTGSERQAYRILFQGSVAGLRSGAAVLFNGIRVGEVTALRLDPADPKQVAAIVGIEKDVAIRTDAKVGLDFQGLTGIASITLKGGSAAAPLLTAKDGELPTLSADPDATKDVTQAIRDVAANAEGVLRRVDSLVADNDASLKAIIANVKSFSAALTENEDEVKEIVANLKGFTATLDRNSERIERIFAGLESLTGESSKTEILDTVRSIRALADNLDKRTEEISEGLTRFSGRGLREWEQLAVEGRKMVSTLDRAIRNFDRNPSRLIWGGGAEGEQQDQPTGAIRRGSGGAR